TLVANFNENASSGIIVFADANVKALCVANWDTNGDGELSYDEAAAVTDLGQVFKSKSTITTFNELQYFTGLTVIGERAFYSCSNLASVVIPNSVTAINQYAFEYCYYLTSVELPNSITTIGQYAFSECRRLASINLPSMVATIGYCAFSYCYGIVSLEIPASVTSIGNMAFYKCTGLEQITVATDNAVFDSRNNCNAIIETGTNTLRFGCKNSTIPNTVTALGTEAFRYMDIPSVIIPESVVTIGSNVFGGCQLLEQISVAEGNSVFDSRDNCNAVVETGTNKLVFGCKNTVIPNTVTAIGQYAFYNYNSLTSIVIPNSVTAINQYAFAYCYYLTSVELPNSLTTIGQYAFYECKRLASINLPSMIATIGYCAFSYCYGLVSLEIPASVTSIGSYAFQSCTGLTSITSLAQYPPTLGIYDVFTNVNKSIPVYVPCNSMYAYQNAFGWDEFLNFTSSTVCNSGEITVTANLAEGGTVTGGGYYEGGAVCTLTAIVNEGYLFINWTKDGEEVSNSETYSFNVDGDATYVANYEQGVVIGSGTATNQHLPSYSYYKYSLSQQIYTAEEIGGGGSIGSVAFYNAGATKTRNYNVYMVHTDKQSFENNRDWVAVTESDLVFSGEVTMSANVWTRLQLDTPFQYDGVSHIALIVDDNSGNLTISPNMACSVFDAQGNQAIRIYSDGTNYDPFNPSGYYGTLHSVKNQIRLGIETNSTFSITTFSNPVEGGTITGSGTYTQGATCTLTATPAEGYTFVNWTENSETVSTDATYSFEVTGARNLVANFVAQGPVTNHWTPIGGTQYNMTMSGIILIDGVEQTVTTLEVGAFCGDECRGSMMPEFFPPTQQYVVSLTVVSNQQSGENITFRLYDHLAQQELDLQCANNIIFESNAIIGTVGDWYQFAFNSEVSVTATVNPEGAGTVTGVGNFMPGTTATLTATANSGYVFRAWTLNGETVSTDNPYTFTVTGATNLVAQFDLQHVSTLPTGWSWWSTYIEMNGNNGLQQLEQSLGHNGLMIKTQSPYVQNYYPSLGYDYWFGPLTNVGLTNEAGYQISLSNACQAVVSGAVADAATHPVTIAPGWNWIGYPVMTQQSLSTALANFTPAANDLIKGQNSSATYYANYGWFPTSFTLTPGKGYMYLSNATENKTLTYAVSRGNSECVEAAERIWTNDEHAFAGNLTVMAVVAIDGEEQRSEALELGAFLGGECRGSAVLTYFEPTDRWYAMLTIAGEEGEEINFAVIDRRKGNTNARSTNRVVFVENAVVGNLDQPYEVSFAAADALKAYPNPVGRNEAFTLDIPSNETVAEVYVYNVLGEVVSHESGAQAGQRMHGIAVVGVYTVKVVCKSGNAYVGRLIVK
nr:leucine-rich repeat protein [Bacteroidales bacterium]